MRLYAVLFTILALLAVLALPQAAQCRGDLWFCNPYGIACWKKADRGFMASLISPKGEYIDSIYLKEGNCFCPMALGCGPCEEKLDNVDWDKTCNEWFPECEGDCFARGHPQLP